MDQFEKLRITQLDESLKLFYDLRAESTPNQGWVKTVREALGMSLRQLAERTGLSKTSVASAEATEARGAVQVDTLRRLARGLDCELVYALVPRVSLENTLRSRAEEKARALVRRVSDSMELEAQRIPSEEEERQIRELAERLLREHRRDFWDD